MLSVMEHVMKLRAHTTDIVTGGHYSQKVHALKDAE